MNPAPDGGLVVAFAGVCVLVICGWVWREYGRRASLVTAVLSAAALACVWVAYEVLPVERWRSGSLANSLAVFAVPALASAIVAIAVSGDRCKLAEPKALVFLAASWITPALVLFVSQQQVAGPRTLPALTWWAMSCIVLYVTVPVAYGMWSGQRIRGYGLSLAFIKTEASLLLLSAPVVLAMAWLASADVRFQSTYPFLARTGADWNLGQLLIFELLYGLSFVGLEFYFRGFLVHAGRAFVGPHAVPMMAFTYCLLHLGKPMPEAAASLIGGLVLGYVSLKLRTIAVGVAAHLMLAWGVDAAVLSRS